jgi:GNAT superfamily N-acetyltransferase/uncharacterized protein (DUF1330 family)
MSVVVRRAAAHDLDRLVPLFDGYRRFYGKAADLPLARRFLAERFAQSDSIVLLAAEASGTAVGFVQLYPSFSSVRAARIYILNDLFVAEGARGHGTGTLLLQRAADAAREAGAVRLKLSTAITNVTAQRLYEALGWQRDQDFYEYGLSLSAGPPPMRTEPTGATPVTLVVSLWLATDDVAAFEAFEQRAAEVMAPHGGRIVSVVRCGGGPSEPFEVHVVTFPSAAALRAYREDPRHAELRELRERVIARTELRSGETRRPYGA